MRHAQDWLAPHYTSWEPVEGMQAFVEKRAPRYALLRDRAARGEATESPWGAPIRGCSRCGVGNLPADHHWCGACGAPLS